MRVLVYTCRAILVVLLFVSESLAADLVRFGVLADPHFFAPEFAGQGPALDAAIRGDRKLLREGPAILDAALAGMSSFNPQFVIVSGDLTKDGERATHEQFAAKLRTLSNAGIPVYVIPGNHDVNNPGAFRYEGELSIPVPAVDPRQFASIYADFGYDSPVARDPNSLSYVAEPVPGLRLLALDSCIYDENLVRGRSEAAGLLETDTLTWAVNQVIAARRANKRIVGFMHHGLVSHTALQEVVFRDYRIENWRLASTILATAGLEVMFTGHFHAQEIVGELVGDQTIYDVKTSSLVTYPCAYRVCQLDDGSGALDIVSPRVREIDFHTRGMPFQDYARVALGRAVHELGGTYLPQLGIDLPPELETPLLGVAARAAVEHFDGDEVPAPEDQWLMHQLSLSDSGTFRFIGAAIESVYTDVPPADNHVRLLLR